MEFLRQPLFRSLTSHPVSIRTGSTPLLMDLVTFVTATMTTMELKMTLDEWKNHGEFKSCVSNASEELLYLGIISEDQKDEINSDAARTNCGKKRR